MSALTPDAEAAWVRLRRHLDWADKGGWIAFVQTPSGVVASQLRERADWQLKAHARKLSVIAPPAPADLAAALPVVERVAVEATHVWLQTTSVDPVAAAETPWDDAWRDFLRTLNHRRDTVRAQFPLGGLIVAGPRSLFVNAREMAPDAWSVRSLVIDVGGTPQVAFPTMRVIVAPNDDKPGQTTQATAWQPDPDDPSGTRDEDLLALHRQAERALAGGALDDAADLASSLAQTALARGRRDIAGLALSTRARARDLSGDMGGAVSDARDALAQTPEGSPLRAAPLDLIGRLSLGTGDLDAALTSYTQSLHTRQRLADTIQTPETQRDLSVSHDNVGGVQQAQGDLDAALTSYTHSLHIRQRLADTIQTPQTQRDLAWVRARIAELEAGSSNPPADRPPR